MSEPITFKGYGYRSTSRFASWLTLTIEGDTVTSA